MTIMVHSSPNVLISLENEPVINDIREYIHNRTIDKSRKLVWINVSNQYRFDRNYKSSRDHAGKILNVVVNDNISKSPMLIEPNTIYNTREGYYDSFVIEMLVQKINHIAC